MDKDSDSGNHSVIQELPTEVSNPEQDTSVTDTDQASTEEQNYRETMCCVRSTWAGHISQI